MQKAYCPPCSMYTLCCPNWVPPPVLTWPGGYLPGYPQQGTPPSRVPPRQSTPQAGYPLPPGWTWQGTPPPGWTWQGNPPGVCPMAFWELLQSIMGYGYPPPGVNKLTKWNYYLPVVLRTRAVNIPNMKFNDLGWVRLSLAEAEPEKFSIELGPLWNAERGGKITFS